MLPCRQRPRLAYTPVWEGPIALWAAKHIRQNQWRCDAIHDFDDLFSDAYLLFAKLGAKYPRVSNAKNFMGLFKTALRNQLHDHARYMQKKRAVHIQTGSDVSECLTDRIGEVTHEGHINAVLAEAPEELRMALALLQSSPEQVRACVEGKPENLNAKLHRLLGLKTKIDITGKLRELLS